MSYFGALFRTVPAALYYADFFGGGASVARRPLPSLRLGLGRRGGLRFGRRGTLSFG